CNQLIELQMVVAETAWDRRAPGEIILHERANHIALEPLLMVYHVIRNSNSLGDAARVVDIVERAAPALHRFRHAGMRGQPSLVPQLHRQTDDIVAFCTQYGRYGRGIDST